MCLQIKPKNQNIDTLRALRITAPCSLIAKPEKLIHFSCVIQPWGESVNWSVITLELFSLKLSAIYLSFLFGDSDMVNTDTYGDFVIGPHYNTKLLWGLGNKKKNGPCMPMWKTIWGRIRIRSKQSTSRLSSIICVTDIQKQNFYSC